MIPNLLALIQEAENAYDLGSAFAKPDFFLPFPVMEGLASATALQEKGIQVHSLASRKIYPMYGVWSPTSQEYLNLFSNYVTQR